MDLHTLVSRIQGLGLQAEIDAHEVGSSKWLSVMAFDPFGSSNHRYYAVDFPLRNGAPLHTDSAINDKLKVIAEKVKAYDEIDREAAVG